jgi:formylglycine-generating enzyme required for sulfatase activity
MHQGLRTAQISRHSIPGVAPATADSATGMSLPIPTPAPKSKLPMVVGGVVLVLLLLGAGTAAVFLLKPTTNSGNNLTNPTPTPTVGPATLAVDMVMIPGGTFQMGRNDGPRDMSEFPAHRVTVPTFYMDRTEVTNAAYAEFLRNSNHPWPTHWKSAEAPVGEDLLPVSNVSLEDANAFASWRSTRDKVTYRLPKEEEWEYAARNGEQSDLYPWGSDWKDNHAVLNEPAAAPVGSLSVGKNRWGVDDLIGNVWEWTSSKLTPYPGNPGTVPSNKADWVTIRGAGYASDPSRKDSPISSCVRSAGPPSLKRPVLGFRLVRSEQ